MNHAQTHIQVALVAVAFILMLAGGYVFMFRGWTGGNPRPYFNWLYKYPIGYFSKNANSLLVETASKLPPGKALDIAMGEGRNAVWLATKGWVTGFDISDEALRQAGEHAGQAGHGSGETGLTLNGTYAGGTDNLICANTATGAIPPAVDLSGPENTCTENKWRNSTFGTASPTCIR